MPGFTSLAVAGKSIERLLNACFSVQEPVSEKTRAVLLRSEEFDTKPGATGTSLPPRALSIFFYRVDFNKTMRAAWSAIGSIDGRSHLPLDLHFLITPWAGDAESELLILGRAMQCLETTPILSGPLLYPATDWLPNEGIQLVLEEISTEAVMRMFDSLPHDYKLSVPYIARVVRIDGRVAAPDPRVTTVITGITPSGP